MPGVQMRSSGAGIALSLMGDVGYEITASAVCEALRGQEGKALTISINSYGGDALAGIAIHNMLARHTGAKTVIVEGIAASAASLIAMAGDRIVMPENAFLMIHNAWGVVMGDADAMVGNAEVLRSISAAYRRTYAQRAGLDEQEVAELMAATTWFTAEDAVAKGFATEATAPAEIRADASRLARFSNVPAALLAAAQPAQPVPTLPAPPASTATQEVRVTDTVPTTAPAADVVPFAPVAATLPELRAIAARGKLGAEFVLAQVEARASVVAATDAALDAVAALAPAPLAGGGVNVLRDEGDTFRTRAAGGLNATLTGRAPAESEREFAAMGFHGLIREIAHRRGERNAHRLDAQTLANLVFASGGHTSSDFAGVLANSTNKTVRDLYAAMPNTWSAWCEETEVDDFKTITAANIGQFPEVVEIVEGGPVTQGTIGEETETYAVRERGRLLVLSRQALINDDTRAFQRIVQASALAGYTALRRTVFGVLTTNAAMADTVALFNAAHGNLGAAGNLSATTYAELRALLAKQTGPSRLGMSPSAAPLPPPNGVVLLVGPDEEDTAMELLGNRIVPTATGATLPDGYRASTAMVMDAFLDTGNDPYYLARSDMKAVEIAYLRGGRAPSVMAAERIDYTGMTFRTTFDFGAKAVTWRTIAGNFG